VRQQCDVINGPHIHSCSAMMLLTPTKFDLWPLTIWWYFCRYQFGFLWKWHFLIDCDIETVIVQSNNYYGVESCPIPLFKARDQRIALNMVCVPIDIVGKFFIMAHKCGEPASAEGNTKS
jgi:hypothetical protein